MNGPWFGWSHPHNTAGEGPVIL